MPLFLLTIVLSGVLTALAPPGGYVPFEFPALYTGPEFASTHWSGAQREQVYFALGLDYLYLVAYSQLLSRWCATRARRLPAISGRGSALRSAARWMWVAGAFDAAENTGLYFWLGGMATKPVAIGISVCAASKFLILGLVVITMVSSLLLDRARRPIS
ncbi:MAG: hypothetical protein EXR86_08400 [Gammaproteobacteria bacterium]|nr:hypothetical protein [Gammaproteobacteria bacterium]